MFYNNATQLLDIPSSKNIAEEMLLSLENCSFMNNTVEHDASINIYHVFQALFPLKTLFFFDNVIKDGFMRITRGDALLIESFTFLKNSNSYSNSSAINA
jgi:hypothetical protein